MQIMGSHPIGRAQVRTRTKTTVPLAQITLCHSETSGDLSPKSQHTETEGHTHHDIQWIFPKSQHTETEGHTHTMTSGDLSPKSQHTKTEGHTHHDIPWISPKSQHTETEGHTPWHLVTLSKKRPCSVPFHLASHQDVHSTENQSVKGNLKLPQLGKMSYSKTLLSGYMPDPHTGTPEVGWSM